MGIPYQDQTPQKPNAPANPGAIDEQAKKQDSKRRPPGDNSPQQGKDAVQAPTTDDEIDVTDDEIDGGQSGQEQSQDSGTRPS